MALITEWSPPPLFTEGQVLSSSGHLNVLIRDTHILFGEHLAPQLGVFSPRLDENYKGFGDDETHYGFLRLFVGACRHKRDTFAYSIHVNQSHGEAIHVRVRCGPEGDNLISETTTAGNHSLPYDVTGTIDVSILHANSFYEVFVDVWGASEAIVGAWVNYLGETYSLTLDPLFDFTSGTPTTAQWQALSTYVETLHDYLSEPNIAPIVRSVPVAHLNPWSGDNDDYGYYQIKHRHRYLAYQFHLTPWPGAADKSTWALEITYDDTPIVRRGFSCLGEDLTADSTTVNLADGAPQFNPGDFIKLRYGEIIQLGTLAEGYDKRFENCLRGQKDTKPSECKKGTYLSNYVPEDHDKSAKKDIFALKDMTAYRGIVDLDDQGLSLSIDTIYFVNAHLVSEGHYDREEGAGQLQFDYLFETPQDDPDLTAWLDLPQHEALTSPDDTAQRLQNNLTWLYAKSSYLNAVSPNLTPNGTDKGGFFPRRRRYLHYYTMSDDQDGTLTYYINGRETTQSISPGAYRWNSLDMNSFQGLYPGTIYRITGVTYALEDDTPMPDFDLDLLT